MFKHTDAIKMFKALADDHRLKIMRLLISGEKCGCVLLKALDIGQPTLSHHMKILCDAGLVDARKKGTWMYYSVSAEGSAMIREMIDYYVVFPGTNPSEISENSTSDDHLCCATEEEI